MIKKYRIGNHIQIGALVPVMLLTFLCLGSFVLFISDLNIVENGINRNAYNIISLVLDIAVCIVIFIAIYLFLDNIFSMEMQITERGIVIHNNYLELNIDWIEIDNIYEETPPIIGKYRYIHLKQKKKLFTKGLMGILFCLLKIDNIFYMLFEKEAIQSIEAKFKI